MSYTDPEKRRAYRRAYYAAHPEKARAQWRREYWRRRYGQLPEWLHEALEEAYKFKKRLKDRPDWCRALNGAL
jgi:hypothetical protein